MIRSRKIPGHKKQYYLYVKGIYDGWHTFDQLFILPECVVTRAMLTKRLFSITKYGPTKTFTNIFDCLTLDPVKYYCQIKKTGIKDCKTYYIDPYLWPAGSLSHTVR